MLDVIGNLLWLPIKFALLLIEFFGRTLAIVIGLGMFGFGAFLCLLGPLILFGAPLCLLGALVVIKAV